MVKIFFTDMYENFNCEIFTRIFDRIGIDYVVSKDPDFLIYGPFGYEYMQYDCARIFWTGENISPDFSQCDYAIGFDYIEFGDRYIRYPLYNFYYEELNKASKKHLMVQDDYCNRSFCSFVVSNSDCRVRNHFFQMINTYKHVDSGGMYMNNIGGRIQNKLEFQNKYKFSVTFENCQYPGYVTEKIVEGFASCTIPIYWGDPTIFREFNKDAFVYVRDEGDFDKVIEKIKILDSDNNLYMQYLRSDINAKSKKYEDKINSFFEHIFKQPADKAIRRNENSFARTRNAGLKKVYSVNNYFKKLKRVFKNSAN